MLIYGELSGIQDYLFDISDTAGGQARRLRARSFYLQTIAETAALDLLKAAGWSANQLVFSAAGKFLLQGETLPQQVGAEVENKIRELNLWLIRRTGAKVRLSIAKVDDYANLVEGYNTAGRELQIAKMRPLSQAVIENGRWITKRLTLDAISPPCKICSRQPASRIEIIHEKEIDICINCSTDMRIGRKLPDANWLEISEGSDGEDDIFGKILNASSDCPIPSASTVAIFDLNARSVERYTSPFLLNRRLGRHTPDADFDTIAEKAQGSHYLGYLKMDADSLGKAIAGIMQGKESLDSLQEFSRRLDEFFSVTLQKEMSRPSSKYRELYTVFSGGDDMLLVGPWNLVFQFANLVHERFSDTFPDLTISGGLAIFPAKVPIRRAVDTAEHLLENAKDAGRNRFAALGQIWEWKDHNGIQHSANTLSGWVNDDVMVRGWLQTLLRMTERIHEEPLTAARLTYHVERNYPKSSDDNPEKRALREWVNQRIADFENPITIETRYLSAILRYALTATRKGDN